MENPDDARKNSQNAPFGATWHASRGRGFGVQAAVAWTVACPKDGALAFETEDRSVDIRFTQKGAGIVDEVACGKIIGAIDHDVVVAEKIEGVVGTESDFVGDDFDVGIKFGNSAAG